MMMQLWKYNIQCMMLQKYVCTMFSEDYYSSVKSFNHISTSFLFGSCKTNRVSVTGSRKKISISVMIGSTAPRKKKASAVKTLWHRLGKVSIYTCFPKLIKNFTSQLN
jgi:hypothetical protein